MTKQKTPIAPTKNHGVDKTVFVLLTLLVLSLSAGGYFFYKYHAESRVASRVAESPEASTKDVSAEVLESLKTRLLITETDSPTVARVEDATKLQQANAEFYKNAQNGDYVIGYPTRVIIFRLDEGKIINLAPIVELKQAGTNAQ